MSTPRLRLDPALATEFRANPLGPHGAAVTKLVDLMRRAPLPGKHFLIRDPATRALILAQQGERRGAPYRRHDDIRFTSKAEAEWHVFCLRWRALTGEPPPGDTTGGRGAGDPR